MILESAIVYLLIMIILLPFYFILDLVFNLAISLITKNKVKIFFTSYIILLLARLVQIFIIGFILLMVNLVSKDGIINFMFCNDFNKYIIVGVFINILIGGVLLYRNFNKKIVYETYFEPFVLMKILLNSIYISLIIYWVFEAGKSV